MDRRKRHETVLAVCLTGLAGYVDALGFLKFSDLFVSFMSGNSTLSAVKATQGSFDEPAKAAALIGSYVLGSGLGSLIGRLAGERRPPVVLVGVTVILAISGLVHLAGGDFLAAVVMALAMGTQNGVFEGKAGIAAVTYVTGTLVRVAQKAVGAAFGEPATAFVQPLLLWLGLVCGASLGTLAWSGFRLGAVWFAAAAAAALTQAAFAMGPVEPRDSP